MFTLKLKPYYLLPIFMGSLVLGIIGGWIRMGWAIQLPAAAQQHGSLMVGGFLGGLITLERTITQKSRWWLLVPAACGFAAISLILDWTLVAQIALVIGAAGLTLFYLHQLTIHQEAYWYVLLAGAVAWLAGNLLWLKTNFVPQAVNYWLAFILLTVLGERLELSRFVPIPPLARKTLWLLLGATMVGLLLPFHGWGRIFYGSAVLLTACWFGWFDIAWLSVKRGGFFRYTGLSMLTAYAWLILHGITVLTLESHVLFYDLFLHTFFLGFAFSMIWAHAPIILPAVLKLKNRPYHPMLWIFWGLFQSTLIARVLTSYGNMQEGRMLTGLLNGISILIMLLALASLAWFKNRKNNHSIN